MYNNNRLAKSSPKPSKTVQENTTSPHWYKPVQNGFRTFRIEESFQTGMTVPFPHDTMEKKAREVTIVIVDSTERMGNLCLDYNPVGGKVQIEVLL